MKDILLNMKTELILLINRTKETKKRLFTRRTLFSKQYNLQ